MIKKIVFVSLFLLLYLFAIGQDLNKDSIVVDSFEYYEDDTYYEEDENDNEESQESLYLGEINLRLNSPLGSMREEFNKMPVGFEFGVYRQLNESIPFYIGANCFWERYASKSIGYYDYSESDGEEYEFSEDFHGNIWGLDVGVKYFSSKSFWVFNPYIQFDFEYRRAYASISNVNLDLDETINTDFEGGNSSLGYDIGIGSIVSFNSSKRFFNFKISYNSGGGLFLYKRNKKSNAVYVIDYFDKKFIPVGFLTIKLGMSFL